jgi:hypothetical protein
MTNQIKIYDNGGETLDRFTVVFIDRPYGTGRYQQNLREALAMDENPFSPLGFGQHTSAMDGTHLGTEIRLEELPEPCQRFVKQNMEE